MVRPDGLEPSAHGLKEFRVTTARTVIRALSLVNPFCAMVRNVEGWSHWVSFMSRLRHVTFGLAAFFFPAPLKEVMRRGIVHCALNIEHSFCLSNEKGTSGTFTRKGNSRPVFCLGGVV